GHPTLDPPAENGPLAVWTAIRATGPQPASAPAPAPDDPEPDEDLFEYLAGLQPEDGPQAMILGQLRLGGGPAGRQRWLDDLYPWADVVFFRDGRLAVLCPDLLDARRRLGEWQAYLQRLGAGTVPPHQAFWFLEVPPQGRDAPAGIAGAVRG